MSRVIAAIALVALILLGGGLVAATAYQAGLSAGTVAAGVAGAATSGAVVAPIVVPAWGWHPWGFGVGFGFFGFLATLFFIVLVIALIRAVVGGGRRGWDRDHGWHGGPGAAVYGGPGGTPSPWRGRAHDAFEAWHREAHGGAASTPGESGRPTDPPAGASAG